MHVFNDGWCLEDMWETTDSLFRNKHIQAHILQIINVITAFSGILANLLRNQMIPGKSFYFSEI